jgi:alpha-1,2-mannosyltransferase
MTTIETAAPRRTRPAALATVAALWVAAIAAHLWYGNRHDFYDLHIYQRAMRWWGAGNPLYEYSQPDAVQGALGYTYPPFAALVMRPLAWLSAGVGEALFTAASVAVLAVTTWWLLAPVARRRGWSPALAVAVALPLVSWLEPVRETITFGQVNLLLVGLVLADLLVALPRGSRWAGIGIGLATAVKLTPAIFIVYLLLTRRWRAAGTAVAAAAGATLLAVAVAPADSWDFWSRALWQTGRVGQLDRTANQSLLGSLARLVAPDEPSRVVWLLLALAVAGYGLWRARSAALRGGEVTGLTLTGLVGGLCSPVTWSHHLYWFAPALVVLLDAAVGAHGRAARRGWAALAAVTWLTTTVAVIAWFEWGLDRSFDRGLTGFLVNDWYVLLMLVLLVALPVRAAAAAEPGGAAVAAVGDGARLD